MKRIAVEFEIKDGYIWAVRPGKPLLRVATEMLPSRIYCDPQGQIFALEVAARVSGEVPFTFRLAAREIFTLNPLQLEQAIAWNGLECLRPDCLMQFLQENIPSSDAVVADDLQPCFEDEAASRWFRKVWRDRRKLALAVV